MSIYKLTGVEGNLISITIDDNWQTFVKTMIQTYQFGHARVTFFGPFPNIASFILTYDGPNLRIMLEKCDGFSIIVTAGTFFGNPYDIAEVHGNVRNFKIDEYARERFVRTIYGQTYHDLLLSE